MAVDVVAKAWLVELPASYVPEGKKLAHKFLLPGINDGSTFTRLPLLNNSEILVISFFDGVLYLNYAFIWHAGEIEWKTARKKLNRHGIQTFEDEPELRFIACAGSLDESIEFASQFIRKSKTLAHYGHALRLDRGVDFISDSQGFACYAQFGWEKITGGCPEFCVNGQTDGVFRLTQRREYDHIKIQSKANRRAAI